MAVIGEARRFEWYQEVPVLVRQVVFYICTDKSIFTQSYQSTLSKPYFETLNIAHHTPSLTCSLFSPSFSLQQNTQLDKYSFDQKNTTGNQLT